MVFDDSAICADTVTGKYCNLWRKARLCSLGVFISTFQRWSTKYLLFNRLNKRGYRSLETTIEENEMYREVFIYKSMHRIRE
jgi:hypothetical protein